MGQGSSLRMRKSALVLPTLPVEIQELVASWPGCIVERSCTEDFLAVRVGALDLHFPEEDEVVGVLTFSMDREEQLWVRFVEPRTLKTLWSGTSLDQAAIVVGGITEGHLETIRPDRKRPPRIRLRPVLLDSAKSQSLDRT